MNAGTQEQTGDSEIERRVRAVLITSADNLPGAVRSRLTQARHAALAARNTHRRHRLQRWAPAGAVAAAALALLVMFVPHGHRVGVIPVANGALEDIDLLTSDVPLNVDQGVDYEFYEWAVDAASGPGPGKATGGVGASSGGT